MCGPYCVEYVMHELREPLDEESATSLCFVLKTSEDGTRPQEIEKFFQNKGHYANFLEDLDFSDLIRLNEKNFVIVDWWSVFDEDGQAAPGDGHYSVVKHITEKKIVLFDPDAPNLERTLSRFVFAAHWYDVESLEDGTRHDINGGAIVIPKPF